MVAKKPNPFAKPFEKKDKSEKESPIKRRSEGREPPKRKK